MCDCIKQTNKYLEEKGLELYLVFMGPKWDARMTIKTQKLPNQKRVKEITILPSFCPICGEPYEKETDSIIDETH